jgi:hypothetical protein
VHATSLRSVASVVLRAAAANPGHGIREGMRILAAMQDEYLGVDFRFHEPGGFEQAMEAHGGAEVRVAAREIECCSGRSDPAGSRLYI